MPNETSRKLAERLRQFCIKCVLFIEKLPKNEFGAFVSDQLTRSSGSPAIHYDEALGAESRRDFIHKMSVCLKELRESNSSLYL